MTTPKQSPLQSIGFDIRDDINPTESLFDYVTFNKLGNQTILCDSAYMTAFQHALEVTRDERGNYRIFPSFNLSGNKKSQCLRFIANGYPELSLHASRIIMNPKDWQKVYRQGDQRDYRAASRKVSPLVNPNDDDDPSLEQPISARETFIKVVSQLAGEQAGQKLSELLLVADALHRPDGSVLAIEVSLPPADPQTLDSVG